MSRKKNKNAHNVHEWQRYPRFAQRLRGLRGNITQNDYAKSLGISLRAYQNYESGKRIPKPAIISKLAEKENVSVDWIFSGSLQGLAEKVVAARVEGSLLYEGLTDAEMRLMRYFFERGMISSEDIDVFMNMALSTKHRKFQEVIDSLVGDKNSPLYAMRKQLERIYNEGDSKKLEALRSLLKALDPWSKEPDQDRAKKF